ncbi:MAG TPA: hypothetical protein DD381_11795 [Lentisphaeria bacterium]|nr:MAG: hypothetical protein A2X47_02640 [Lentisphaerae bacterium GWF2_38_69]HBM17008.1 hypothetical protein [Lentisphaeria bacterium]
MNNFEDSLIKFCSQKPHFILKEAETVLGKIKPHNQSIADLLEYCSLTFRDLSKKQNDRFFSRHHFFKGFKFKIELSDFEIENSLLIPGHKFIPFYFSDLFSSSLSLIDNKTKKPIPSKRISFKLRDLYEYYFAFPSETIKESIIADDKTNSKVIGKNPDGIVTIRVFDLKQFFKSLNCNNFNFLILEVSDWTKGEFIIDICKNELTLDQEQAYMFAEELESSLYKVFEYFGPYIDVPEQLAWAFFLSEKKILNIPIITLEEALHISENIDYKYFEDNSILWFKNDDVTLWEKNCETTNNNPFSISSGKISSIDSIFDELGIPLTSKELNLFINTFGEKDLTLSSFISNCLPVHIPFKDKAQEVALLNKIEELYENPRQIILFPDNSSDLKFIHSSVIRLRKIFIFYSFEKLTVNRSKEEASLAYREIRDQINSLSSILSFYMNNPDNLNHISKISALTDYIENHFSIIESFLNN